MKYKKSMLFKYWLNADGSQAVWLLRHLPRLQAACLWMKSPPGLGFFLHLIELVLHVSDSLLQVLSILCRSLVG